MRYFQAVLAYRVFHTSHMGRFFVFFLCTVDLNLQNLGFIPEYLMAFLECMLRQFRFVYMTVFNLNLCSPILTYRCLPISPT
jgi:hypothetical protein